MTGRWFGKSTALWPLSGSKSGYRERRFSVQPISPQGHPGRRNTDQEGHVADFLCVRQPPGEGWQGTAFLQRFSAGDIFPGWGRFAVRLQLGLPYGGPSSISVRATQQRCSRPLLQPLPAAATKIKTATAKIETSTPRAAAARRRRDGQGLDNTVCGQNAIWAWKEVHASRCEPTG